MKSKLARFAPIFLMMVACLVFAQEAPPPDAEGCKDSALLSRMPGCTISECSSKEYDEAEILMGEENKTLEGKTEILAYQCPLKFSGLQIVRNAEGAMRKAGFTIVLSGHTGVGTPIVTGRKGAQWLQVEGHDGGDYAGYRQTAVKVQEVEQQMEATADAMAEQIKKSGHVAIYGINFDIGKATVKPESETVLSEIVKLLNNNSDWKLRVEGHTDNVGAKASNQKLSEQRAAAVVAWLAEHGVGRARLTPQGFGDTKPVADNNTEEGRAKNRRVELAKQ